MESGTLRIWASTHLECRLLLQWLQHNFSPLCSFISLMNLQVYAQIQTCQSHLKGSLSKPLYHITMFCCTPPSSAPLISFAIFHFLQVQIKKRKITGLTPTLATNQTVIQAPACWLHGFISYHPVQATYTGSVSYLAVPLPFLLPVCGLAPCTCTGYSEEAPGFGWVQLWPLQSFGK